MVSFSTRKYKFSSEAFQEGKQDQNAITADSLFPSSRRKIVFYNTWGGTTLHAAEKIHTRRR